MVGEKWKGDEGWNDANLVHCIPINYNEMSKKRLVGRKDKRYLKHYISQKSTNKEEVTVQKWQLTPTVRLWVKYLTAFMYFLGLGF